MTNPNTFTIEDIRNLDPCYDPVTEEILPPDWTGTALDILKIENSKVSAEDKLWVVARKGWIDDRTLRLFAVWCARQALDLMEKPDPRSVEVCNVSERFANGEATQDELAAAWDAARDAARAAARAAAWDAAWDAARDAAWAAAWAAARSAARDAAWDAAWDAARAAALNKIYIFADRLIRYSERLKERVGNV